MGGACASAPSKSIEPPGVSTLSERLSKQLISVLGTALVFTPTLAPFCSRFFERGHDAHVFILTHVPGAPVA